MLGVLQTRCTVNCIQSIFYASASFLFAGPLLSAAGLVTGCDNSFDTIGTSGWLALLGVGNKLGRSPLWVMGEGLALFDQATSRLYSQ